jgi:hypothetical protein
MDGYKVYRIMVRVSSVPRTDIYINGDALRDVHYPGPKAMVALNIGAICIYQIFRDMFKCSLSWDMRRVR